MKRFISVSLLLSHYLLMGQTIRSTIIFEDHFDSLSEKNWKVEMDPQPGSSVTTSNNEMILNTKGGVTVWLNRSLSGHYRITFTRTILVNNEPNDRCSDMNFFWNAQDSHNSLFFRRRGVLQEYDSLTLYYAGIGGNTNKTSRFRRYNGKGDRVLLQEYLDKEHLLIPNTPYTVMLEVNNGKSELWINGKLFFEFQDPEPILQGYFGFRSTYSRQSITDFKLIQFE